VLVLLLLVLPLFIIVTAMAAIIGGGTATTSSFLWTRGCASTPWAPLIAGEIRHRPKIGGMARPQPL
jgi:hypothetical protein